MVKVHALKLVPSWKSPRLFQARISVSCTRSSASLRSLHSEMAKARKLGMPGWQSADDWAALFACGLIAANGWRLFNPALHEVLDTAPRGEIVERVRIAAAAVPGVVEVEKCFVRKMGLEFYVDLHVGVDERISVRAGHDLAHEVKNAIRQTNPRIADVLVHVEPVKSTQGRA